MAMDKYVNKRLAIIGSGHISRALIKGLVNSGISSTRITVSNPSGSGLVEIRKQFGVHISNNNKDAMQSDWIFIAVKPLVVKQVIEEISQNRQNKLIISLAACISVEMLKRYTGCSKQNFIRIIPNIPIAIRDGVIGLYADNRISKLDIINVTQLLNRLGKVFRVRVEKDLDSLTILSGCGPAIVSHFIELMFHYGVKLGLSKKVSDEIALQTFAGTVSYLRQTNMTPVELNQSVATKGGITEEILKKMSGSSLEEIFITSMNAGYSRITARL